MTSARQLAAMQAEARSDGSAQLGSPYSAGRTLTSHDHVFRACTRNVSLTSLPAEVLAKIFWSLQSEED